MLDSREMVPSMSLTAIYQHIDRYSDANLSVPTTATLQRRLLLRLLTTVIGVAHYNSFSSLVSTKARLALTARHSYRRRPFAFPAADSGSTSGSHVP